MENTLARNWWLVALRGVAAIIFGILLLLFPPVVIETLVLLFGVYAFIDGIGSIVTAIQNRARPRWWVTLLEGIIGIIAGVLVFAFPVFATISATLFVLYIVAFWAIATGVMEVWSAIQLRKEIDNEFWMGLGGALSILFGVLLLLNPAGGILALITIVAAYAIIFGVFLLLLAFRLRGMRNTPTSTSDQTRQTA